MYTHVVIYVFILEYTYMYHVHTYTYIGLVCNDVMLDQFVTASLCEDDNCTPDNYSIILMTMNDCT